MINGLTYSTKTDGSAVSSRAVEWLRAFHPIVDVSFDGEVLRLDSSVHSQAGLRLIWQSAFANETLLARGAARRAAVLDDLTR
jgi:hypothetical protein